MDNGPQVYVFDLDGVIYRGNEPQPNASITLRELRTRGRRIFFFTNNSTKSREDYQEKLSSLGVPCALDEIMTSAYATALYIRHSLQARGTRAFVVGEAGLAFELERAGVEVVRDGLPSDVDYVIVGLDRQFNYDKLVRAQHAIFAGAKFVATNRDASYPEEGGVVIPGSGAIVSAVETASGVRPVVIGKPEPYALERILELSGGTPQESVMVGDRLETDILLGNRVGMHTALVLTGVSDENAALAAPLEMRPKRIISDLIELFDESWAAS